MVFLRNIFICLSVENHHSDSVAIMSILIRMQSHFKVPENTSCKLLLLKKNKQCYYAATCPEVRVLVYDMKVVKVLFADTVRLTLNMHQLSSSMLLWGRLLSIQENADCQTG